MITYGAEVEKKALYRVTITTQAGYVVADTVVAYNAAQAATKARSMMRANHGETYVTINNVKERSDMKTQDIIHFATAVLGDWHTATDKFFTAVEKERVARNLSVKEVTVALREGYGSAIADEWLDWSDEGDLT